LTLVTTYVGRMDDAQFNWHRALHSSDSNIPRPITRDFPPGDVADELCRRIRDGEYEGKQTDWGAWVARVSRQQILEFLEHCYGGSPTYSEKSSLPWLRSWYRELREEVEALDADSEYAFVCAEMV
jgi:hypothetical protein